MLPSSCAQSDGRSTATGNWPASVQELINANELPANAIDSPYTAANGAPIPWVLNTVNDRLIVSIDTTSEKYAARVAGSDLPFLSRAGNVISSEVTRSGSEQAHDALYARDGSRKLTGTMDADGNNIQGAGNIGTQSLSATGLITSGSLDVTGDVAVGGTLKASSFTDTDADPNEGLILNLSGESILGGLTTRGLTKVKGKLMLDNYDPVTQQDGLPCEAKMLALDSEGNLLTCKNGFWAKTSGDAGGSKVITGTVIDGQIVPVPKGYMASECRTSLAITGIPRARTYISDIDAEGTPGGIAKCGWGSGDADNFGKATHYNSSCTYTTVCNSDASELAGTLYPKGSNSPETIQLGAGGTKTVTKDTGGKVCNSVVSAQTSSGHYKTLEEVCGNPPHSTCAGQFKPNTVWTYDSSNASYHDNGSYFSFSCAGTASCTFTLACTVK